MLGCRMLHQMNILGYIVQVFYEDNFMPDTGYKHLFTTYSHALQLAEVKVQEYLTLRQGIPHHYFEMNAPTKKQVDANGFAIVYRNTELQIWIEVIVSS
jgi:hypothetical protein